MAFSRPITDYWNARFSTGDVLHHDAAFEVRVDPGLFGNRQTLSCCRHTRFLATSPRPQGSYLLEANQGASMRYLQYLVVLLAISFVPSLVGCGLTQDDSQSSDELTVQSAVETQSSAEQRSMEVDLNGPAAAL